jgi:hypothetical protein
LYVLERHVQGDWGEVDAEDGRLKDEAMKTPRGGHLSAAVAEKGKLRVLFAEAHLPEPLESP